MAECDYRDNCRNNPVITTQLSKSYCCGNYRSCARFKIRTGLGDDYVPKNLKPNEHEKAREIINHGYMHHEERLNTFY
ncbi:MAG: hypothetical protein ACFFD1_05790 [Candidatus Thorarchaeota archaeon]